MKYSFYLLICLQVIACNNNRGKVIRPLVQVQNDSFKEIVLNDEISAISCANVEPIVIDVPPQKLYTADQIIENYTFIPLETSENSLMGDIEDLCTDDNYIFVFDHSNSKVLQFTDDGKFVRKVGNQGRGPQEYNEIWNIALDKETKRICLLDLAGRKLIYFDYDGNCVKEEPLYYLFTDLQFEKGMRYIYTGSAYNKNAPRVDLHKLVVSDNEQRPLYRGFPITERIRDNFCFVPQYPIRKFVDGIYYQELMSDTIWNVEADKYIPSYVLNFPERGELFSSAERENITDELYRQKIRLAEQFTGRYLITDRIVYFSLVGNDESRIGYPLLYSKKTGDVLCGSADARLFTSRVGDLFYPQPSFIFQDSAFVAVRQPQIMKEIVKSLSEEEYDKLSIQDKLFMENLDAEDNPVLMIIKYKDF